MSLKNQFLLLSCLCILILSACAAPSASPTPTMVPTIALTSPTAAPTQEAAAPENAYPAQGGPTEMIADYPYPVEDGGPAIEGMPTRENRSRVTAKLIEQAPDSANPDLVRLHVLVSAVADVEGMPNMAGDLLNQESDLFVQKDKLAALQPDQSFDAEISYRGDEQGAKFFIVKFLP
jgi:hypothetical protein